MKALNKIQNQVVEVVSNNVVDYFANSITSSDFVQKHIRPIVTVSEEQEEKISDILSEYNRYWDNADCDSEGATQEQDAELDRIIDECSKAIANVVVMMKTLDLDKILTMDDLRYSFDWLTFCKSFPILNKLTSQSDDAFLLDTRVTDDLRVCQIIFLKEEEKIGQLFFSSGFGRVFQNDLRDQIANIKEVVNGNDIICYSANA